MSLDPAALPVSTQEFLAERHLGTLTTLRPDGSPHVVAIGFTWDAGAGLVRIISFAPSTKARNLVAAPGSRAAVCQVDGGRWLTLEGTIEVVEDAEEVADAVARYARRYRPLTPKPERVVLRLTPDKVTASPYLA